MGTELNSALGTYGTTFMSLEPQKERRNTDEQKRVHDGLISESFTHLTEDMCRFNLLKNRMRKKIS